MSIQHTLNPEDLFAGKYRIVRRIGQGGMGEVYEAENKWTARRVALKFLHQELLDQPAVVSRFVQEGRSATMITHPNIVDVLDMGRDPQTGRFYMVQEYLTGVGLDKLLVKRGPFNVRDTLDIVLPVMGGLAATHRRGVIHRDVKPENIIMTQTPHGTFVPKLIDFGIAKLIGAKRPAGTHSRALLGTPHYISPEQLDEADQVDQRTDVWSVGVILYEMLSGRCPFDADGIQALYKEIRHGHVLPLTQVAIDVPSSLADVVHDALQRDLAKRHASMDRFISAILSCHDIEPMAHWLTERHRDSIPQHHRRHERYAVGWSCQVVCKKWQRALSLVASNISQGGVFIASTSPPEPNTPVTIELRLPDGSNLRLQGTVLRAITPNVSTPRQQAGFAVRFADDHANDLIVLEQIAATHQEQGYDQPPNELLNAGRPGSDTIPSVSSGTSNPAPSNPAQWPTIDGLPPRPPTATLVSAHTVWCEAVGMDFGTTYGRIAIALDHQVYAIPDAKEHTLHPSLVYYPEHGQPLVGWDARRHQLEHPKRIVSSVKRVLGRSIDDPMVQGYLRALACDVVAGPGRSIVFEIDDTQVTPIQVAAEQLNFLRRIAETHTGRELHRVVIGIPIGFGEPQRRALQRAAAIAGLEILELISEPIAAVTAYGFGQERREVVAVYDFGGGTFDFSVLELAGNEHRVLSSDGDPWLGGDDFDLAIAHEATHRFWRETNTDLRQLAVEWQRVLFASEHVKRALSTQLESELMLPNAVGYPRSIDLCWKLNRGDLERLCAEAFSRSIEVCRRSLESLDLTRERIDRVVITGGTSRIPFIQRELARFFQREVVPLIDPELSVCMGAGLRAAVLTRHPVQAAAQQESRSRPVSS